MDRLNVLKLLNGEIPPEQFSARYNKEGLRFQDNLKKTGATAPICLTGQTQIYLDDRSLELLIQYVRERRLVKGVAMYVFDAMSLDEGIEFSSVEVRESLLDFSDSEFG